MTDFAYVHFLVWSTLKVVTTQPVGERGERQRCGSSQKQDKIWLLQANVEAAETCIFMNVVTSSTCSLLERM